MAQITIMVGDETILMMGKGPNVLVPMEDSERTAAFHALTAALAAIAGVTPLRSSVSKEAETDEHCEETSQCPPDRKSGAVVHLSERLASRTIRHPD